MAVHLVMEGYLNKEIASMLNLCCQSEAFYVSLFNEGGIDLLLDRKHLPSREPFLTAEQQQELKQIILIHTPAELGWDISSSWNMWIIQSYTRERYVVTMSQEGIRKLLFTSNGTLLELAHLYIGERRYRTTISV
ncbi:hypothetical protein [Geobacillus thermodenitrificans]|uniref:hypothetical protein n=1 Tax=Geobacillus thermodenitrificans TaxID=33940 RepID=UPI00399C6A5F